LRKLVGWGSLSPRKGEDMEVGKGERFHQSIGMSIFFFCLPWKSYDDICSNGEIWNSQIEFLDEAGEKRTVIVSIHFFQYLIVSTLDRNVKVRADLSRLRKSEDKFLRAITWLNGTKSNSIRSLFLLNAFDEFF
jgi:hypothetical protein